MEAALRTAYAFITGENPPEAWYNLQPVRGYEGIREATVTIAGIPVSAAIVLLGCFDLHAERVDQRLLLRPVSLHRLAQRLHLGDGLFGGGMGTAVVVEKC